MVGWPAAFQTGTDNIRLQNLDRFVYKNVIDLVRIESFLEPVESANESFVGMNYPVGISKAGCLHPENAGLILMLVEVAG